jgi:hypothetical protein
MFAGQKRRFLDKLGIQKKENQTNTYTQKFAQRLRPLLPSQFHFRPHKHGQTTMASMGDYVDDIFAEVVAMNKPSRPDLQIEVKQAEEKDLKTFEVEAAAAKEKVEKAQKTGNQQDLEVAEANENAANKAVTVSQNLLHADKAPAVAGGSNYDQEKIAEPKLDAQNELQTSLQSMVSGDGNQKVDSTFWAKKFNAFLVESTPTRRQKMALVFPALLLMVILYYLTRSGKASAKKAAQELGEFCRPNEAPLSLHNREYLIRAQLLTAMQVPASAVFRGADGVERKDASQVCGRVQQLLGQGAHGKGRTPLKLFAALVSMVPAIFMARSLGDRKTAIIIFVGWCMLVGSGYFFMRASEGKEMKWRKTLKLLSSYFDRHGVGELGLPDADFELSGVTEATLNRLLEGRQWYDTDSMLVGATSSDQRKHAMRVIKMELGISMPLTAVVGPHMDPLEGRELTESVIAFVIGHQEATLRIEGLMRAAAKVGSAKQTTSSKSVPAVMTSDVDEDDVVF